MRIVAVNQADIARIQLTCVSSDFEQSLTTSGVKNQIAAIAGSFYFIIMVAVEMSNTDWIMQKIRYAVGGGVEKNCGLGGNTMLVCLTHLIRLSVKSLI